MAAIGKARQSQPDLGRVWTWETAGWGSTLSAQGLGLNWDGGLGTRVLGEAGLGRTSLGFLCSCLAGFSPAETSLGTPPMLPAWASTYWSLSEGSGRGGLCLCVPTVRARALSLLLWARPFLSSPWELDI